VTTNLALPGKGHAINHNVDADIAVGVDGTCCYTYLQQQQRQQHFTVQEIAHKTHEIQIMLLRGLTSVL
jgi:hypothetical protein